LSRARCQTIAPDVCAIGECAGSPQFTHVSFDDIRIVRDNLAGGDVPLATGGSLCMFTDPPLARVGSREGEVPS
jgi:pyruvate/2-oxoglutarate dehydrogenase complex dihydrolipoamide dehydrogenase (E3) component